MLFLSCESECFIQNGFFIVHWLLIYCLEIVPFQIPVQLVYTQLAFVMHLYASVVLSKLNSKIHCEYNGYVFLIHLSCLCTENWNRVRRSCCLLCEWSQVSVSLVCQGCIFFICKMGNPSEDYIQLCTRKYFLQLVTNVFSHISLSQCHSRCLRVCIQWCWGLEGMLGTQVLAWAIQ